MGYSTKFTGTLEFTFGLTELQLAKLKTLCGADPQDFGYRRQRTGYIDLEPTKDFKGLQWDGSEKTYYLGEEIEDRWRLVMEAPDRAVKIEVPMAGAIIKCPHCGEKFIKE